MVSVFKVVCVATLLATSVAHADVGREEMLAEIVRKFAAQLESEWQQCLKSPDTRTTNDSERCALTMQQAAEDAVRQKYQEKLVRTEQDALQKMLPEDVPPMLRKAQAAWEQYVKADCDAVGALVTGTASTTYHLVCEYRHNVQRLHALDEW